MRKLSSSKTSSSILSILLHCHVLFLSAVKCKILKEKSKYDNLLIIMFSSGFDVDLSKGISSPSDCSKSHTLLILVHSAPSRADLRSSIRETWANHGPLSRLVFLIGRSNQFDDAVKDEAMLHQDIFFYDLQDSYQNMTTKHMMGYRSV